MIQVQIVDDHKILVEGLRQLIDKSGFAITSDVSYSGTECLIKLRQKLPDVLLLDINLPDANGIELCKEIKETYPTLKIIALTMYHEYAVVKQMLTNGANGYVLKNAMPEEILLSIEAVMENEIFLCEQVDAMIKKRSFNPIWITPREKELLRYVVNGFTNSEIAEKMFLGVETINSYRKNLLLKLGAKNTAVLVRIAIEEKLI